MLNASEVGKNVNRHAYTILRWARQGLIPFTKKDARTIEFDLTAVRMAMIKNHLKFGSKPCKKPHRK